MGGSVSRKMPSAPDGTMLVHPRSLTLGQSEFLRTDNGSAVMNIDGRSTGTAVNIWNGTGAGDTGADWTASGTGSETAGSSHSGTNGWDTGVTSLNNNTNFDIGSDVNIVDGYSELNFWLQPKAFPPGAKLSCFWRNSSNQTVGNNLNVANYTTNMDIDVWQQVSIPIADFALTGDVDKLRFKYAAAAGQQHWIDDIEIVTTANGPFRFRVAAPDAYNCYHLSMAVLVISAPSAGWNPTAFANIANGLSKGVIFRHKRISTGDVLWSINSKDNTDLFGRFHPQDDIVFANGDMLVGFMIKPGKASVVISDDDVLDFVVRDDLSSLTSVRAFAHYGIEVIPQ
jgi:hypothetical protein